VRDIITLSPALLRRGSQVPGSQVPSSQVPSSQVPEKVFGSQVPGSQVPQELWLEVSEEHPAMIEAWVGSPQYVLYVQKMQREFGVFDLQAEFVSGICDLSGNPRFTRLRYI
jgi:hypothetical protein